MRTFLASTTHVTRALAPVVLLAATLTVLVALGAEAITNERLLSAQKDAANWLMYGKSYLAWRYSELSDIDVSNVAKLVPRWIFQLGVEGKSQTTPLVNDGLMYITGPSNHAWALDLLTGRPTWHYSATVPKEARGCCGQPNRGFAALGDRLFKVNYEGTLVALDAKTGDALWGTFLADYKKGYSATGTPLLVKNMVVVGIAGAEFGTRDFLDAYDVETGKRV